MEAAFAQRQKARTLLELRRPAEARAILGPIVASDPRDAIATVILAGCWAMEGDGPRALALCRSAAAYAPQDSGILIDCASVARGAGFPDDAATWAAAATRLAPHSVRALNVCCLIEVDRKDATRALRYAEAALRLAPDDADLLVAYGMALSLSKRGAEAARAYVAALDASPTNVYALNNLAAERLGCGDLVTSSRLFGRALSIDPRLRIAVANLDVAGAAGRRILLSRAALTIAAVSIAKFEHVPWLYGVGLILLGWLVWSWTRLPSAVRARLNKRLRARDWFGLAILALALSAVLTPPSSRNGAFPDYAWVATYGVVVTFELALLRLRADVALKRLGVRLP